MINDVSADYVATIMRLDHDRVVSRERAVVTVARGRKDGQRIGFTSGTFDLLHAGHVFSLREARAQCDLLVVGVRSDRSVRACKGDGRPVQQDALRAYVVASLAEVDLVFLFDEVHTDVSVELLRPDVYVKRGDYHEERSPSAATVRAYGGEVSIVPSVPGVSTTLLLDRIVSRFGPPTAHHVELPPYEFRPAVFLDRDGTLITHVDYLHEPSRVDVLPGALSAARRMQQAGFRLVVMTNQPGIGTGYFTKDDFFRVNKRFLEEATRAQVRFDRIFFCPHSVGDRCMCRKPEIGMITRAVDEMNIDLPQSFVIGDMTSDIEAGRRAGCTTILVRTGFGGSDGRYRVHPDHVVDTLTDAAVLIERILLDRRSVTRHAVNVEERR